MGNETEDYNEKYIVDLAISYIACPKNRFYDPWSSRRTLDSLGVKFSLMHHFLNFEAIIVTLSSRKRAGSARRIRNGCFWYGTSRNLDPGKKKRWR